MNTGFLRQGYPSLGSWVTYGLGTLNQNLPGYVVLLDHRGGPISGPPNWVPDSCRRPTRELSSARAATRS